MLPDCGDVPVSALQVFADPVVPRMLPDCGDVPVSALQDFADPVVPLIPPDTGRIDRFDNKELELRDSRIGEFSVLSLGICDPSIDMNIWIGMSWLSAHVTLGYRAVTNVAMPLVFRQLGSVGTFPLQSD